MVDQSLGKKVSSRKNAACITYEFITPPAVNKQQVLQYTEYELDEFGDVLCGSLTMLNSKPDPEAVLTSESSFWRTHSEGVEYSKSTPVKYLLNRAKRHIPNPRGH